MKRKKRFFFLGLLFLIACKDHRRNEVTDDLKSMNEGRLLTKDFFITVPYRETPDGAAVIEVTVGGKKRRFMIDTGAPLSLSKSLQKELNPPVLQDVQLRDANGDTTAVKIVRVEALSIGEVQVEGVPALVLDLESPLFACEKLDGLIGSNLLRSFIIRFNKKEKRLSLGDRIDSFHVTAGTVSLAMQVNDVQSDPLIPVQIGAGITDTVLYDTGDGHFYNLSKSKFDAFNNGGRLSGTVLHKGIGVGSQGIIAANTNALPSMQVKIDRFAIGKAVVQNVVALQQYDTRSRAGRGLWEYGLVTMDYPGRRFYFTPHQTNETFNAEPDFGFQFQEREGKLLVTVVWGDTEAARCGLKPGDEVVQLGSFVPKNTPLCEWTQHSCQQMQADTLQVRYRGQDEKTKTCVLARIQYL